VRAILVCVKGGRRGKKGEGRKEGKKGRGLVEEEGGGGLVWHPTKPWLEGEGKGES